MTEKKYSVETEGLLKNLEKLIKEADKGSYEALQRVEVIRKLANPIYSFSPSDYKRILNKKLTLPVKKGIELYKMMRELTFLVQPIGKKKGSACFVRRVDYENLTWEEFLELRGVFNTGFVFEAMKQRSAPKFSALNILNEKQKELYRKIGVYFGNKKKPTLQSLAINILNSEADGEDFSERSLYIYLNAVKEYQEIRRKAAGFDVFYFTFDSVTRFNDTGTGRTMREAIEQMEKTAIEATTKLQLFAAENIAKSIKDLIPQISTSLIQQIQIPNLGDLFRPVIENAINFNSLIKADETINNLIKENDTV